MKGNILRLALVMLALGFVFTSCKTGLHIEKSYNFQSNQQRIRKMTCLIPQYQKLVKDDGVFVVDSNSEVLQGQLARLLVKHGKRSGKQMSVVDWGTIKDKQYFYNTLLKLHEQIMAVNFNQLDIVSKKLDSHEAYLLPNPIRIYPEYSFLSDSFGTPYILCSGVISKTAGNASFTVDAPYSMFFFFVIDIKTAEVLYRTQKFSLDPIKKHQLQRLIQQSLKEMQY